MRCLRIYATPDGHWQTVLWITLPNGLDLPAR
jgi:hypothetical protein